MRHGYIRVAAGTPKIKVADCKYNALVIIDMIKEADKKGAKLLVLPELCITGYTCGDLFLQDSLLDSARNHLIKILESTITLDIVTVIGLPLALNGKLYNCAAVIQQGKILGIVPKTNIPNYSEFYEARHFTPAPKASTYIKIDDTKVPFSTDLLFCCEEYPEFVLAVEICEDLWAPYSPSIEHTLAGATIIANPAASSEIIGKDRYRRNFISSQSSRLLCGYVYAGAGEGESTTDLVFGGNNIIAENGTILNESPRFSTGIIYNDIDTKKIIYERRRVSTFDITDKEYNRINFSIDYSDLDLIRKVDSLPFVPSNIEERAKRCEEILTIQALGLKKRLEHTNCKSIVMGISGGLDSTLALLVTVRAFDMLNLSRDGILAITMPCFGTTDRTYNNAIDLSKSLGVSIREVPIGESVSLHFRDIGQDPDKHDITYENSQARERTQVLMDIANMTGGLVIGTGDLSELALGWATYNGDHMSMYAVNSSVPKTLVRHIVDYVANTTDNNDLKRILIDILDTPVSPELLPPKNGEIAQKTEHIVGPYELHDFFLYNIMRCGYAPTKVFRLAQVAFKDVYENAFILQWLIVFYRRFFSQQFKRSCIPDGPKIGSVALSPRGDWRMPSDASAAIWMEELENIKP